MRTVFLAVIWLLQYTVLSVAAFNHCLPPASIQNTHIATWLPQAVQSWARQFPYGASHFGTNVEIRNAERALLFLHIEVGSGAGSCLSAEHLSRCATTSSSHCQMPGGWACWLVVYHLCWNKPSSGVCVTSRGMKQTELTIHGSVSQFLIFILNMVWSLKDGSFPPVFYFFWELANPEWYA